MAHEKKPIGVPAPGGTADPDREEFLRRAGELYDEMMARAGADGQTFDDIEELALKLGRRASQELMAKRLGAEEHKGRQPQVCPRCGHQLRWASKPEERNLETSAGVVRYERRHAFCDRCRESFSPAGLEADDPQARGVEPSGPEDM